MVPKCRVSLLSVMSGNAHDNAGAAGALLLTKTIVARWRDWRWLADLVPRSYPDAREHRTRQFRITATLGKPRSETTALATLTPTLDGRVTH